MERSFSSKTTFKVANFILIEREELYALRSNILC
jgi:hypothetical protein